MQCQKGTEEGGGPLEFLEHPRHQQDHHAEKQGQGQGSEGRPRAPVGSSEERPHQGCKMRNEIYVKFNNPMNGFFRIHSNELCT